MFLYLNASSGLPVRTAIKELKKASLRHSSQRVRLKNYSRLFVAYLRPDNESCHGHHGAGKYFCVHDEVEVAFVGDVYLAIQIHDLLLKNNSGRCNQANILYSQSCTTSDFYTCNRKFCLNIVEIQDVNF